MASGLESYAQQVAGAALPLEPIELGPWLGSVRSVSADQVGPEWMTAGSNFLWVPRGLEGRNPALGRSYGSFRRRGGQTIKFDTLPTPVGLLPAQWLDAAAPLNAKCRQMEEFKSATLASDGVPTIAALVTKEAVASGLDDGRFSNFYVRDQVNSSDYTLGSEFSATTYPAPGTAQSYRVTPLWYDSGEGGLTRGTAEFARRFFVSGSRRFLKAGNRTYFPSVLGTPSRWNGDRATSTLSHQYGRPTAFSGSNWRNQANSATNIWNTIDESVRDDADYVTEALTDAGGSQTGTVTLWAPASAGFTPPVGASATFRITAKRVVVSGSPAGTEKFRFTLLSGATTVKQVDTTVTNTSGFDLIEVTLSAAEYALITIASSFTVEISTIGQGDLHLYHDVSWMELDFFAGTLTPNHLMPSGPIPPCHAGSLAKGTLVAGSVAVTLHPDADSIDGAWLNESASATNLFASIDETTASDTDYITSAPLGAFCSIGLSNPGFTPGDDDTVVVNFRAKRNGSLSPGVLSVNLREGTVNRSTSSASLTTSYANYSFTLTNAEKASISDWTNLFITFFAGGADSQFVSFASVTVTPTADVTAGWRGSNRFYWGIAYRFEDDSVWMPCTPRAPNDLLTNGFNLFTVDSANPTARYNKIVWSNLARGPNGTKSRLLLRGPKIDSTSEDNLRLDPYDLRVVWEIQDNTTTTYDDYFADDDALFDDVGEAFIRFDHIMPPRARYIFGGDMRICHSYGGQNPCAIVIAPVGRAADYDLNLNDDTASAYNYNASFMFLAIDSSGAGTLTLEQTDGTSVTSGSGTPLSLAFTTYDTLQKLVDKINSTSVAVEGQQWRAQLCPGANPDASPLSLTPHSRAIASCVVSGQTITKAAGGLSKAAVGNLISGAGVTTGAYVSRIDSDTQLTFVGTITAGTKTLTFYTELGDAPTVATTNAGYQRVIGNALPGFLYFANSYLDDVTLYKQRVWMTVASPGQVKSAANNFSGKQSNRFAPANANVGISMGGAAVDQGYVVPFANGIGVIRNTRDTGSGIDEDYRLQMLNESEGCCAWNTVDAGNRFAVYMKRSGIYAADLDREVWLSEAIFKPPSTDATLGTGDFDYEIPLCLAATSADTDAAYASARILRRTLWLSYRDSGTRPDRNLRYDFSGGIDHAGLAAVLRDDGQTPWGWSNELVLPITPSLMVAGRRSDGEHFYGWSEANAGSTGDGRIDEFETGETDNGTAIDGTIDGPVLKGDAARQISGQEFIAEHSAPTGSTGQFIFTRSALATSGDAYTLTPLTSNSVIMLRDLKMLTLAARVASAACKFGYRQQTGTARELRKMTLFVKKVHAYK